MIDGTEYVACRDHVTCRTPVPGIMYLVPHVLVKGKMRQGVLLIAV